MADNPLDLTTPISGDDVSVSQSEPTSAKRPVGRPSVREERRTQIYAAVEDCLVEFGFAGTTLDAIAERAGVQRSAIAHFAGNRDDVIDAALTRSVDRFVDVMAQQVSDVPAEQRLDEFVKALLRPDPMRYRIIALVDEVITQAHRDPHANELLKRSYMTLDAFVSEMVREKYPTADKQVQETLGTALILLLRELDRVQSLGATANMAKQRKLVGRAIDALMAATERN